MDNRELYNLLPEETWVAQMLEQVKKLEASDLDVIYEILDELSKTVHPSAELSALEYLISDWLSNTTFLSEYEEQRRQEYIQRNWAATIYSRRRD